MPTHPHTILVGTDLSARSDRPMERTILLADQLSASVIVLHVPGKTPLDPEEEQKLRSQIEEDFDLSGINAEIVFEHGSVPEVIANVTKEWDCGLIVTGVARFNSLRDYFLGAPVDDLVRLSPAPVLVVKRRPRKPYQRLLVTTDFSECSVEALRTAAAIFPKATLRVVHSFHAAWEVFLERESTIHLIRQESNESMERLVDSLPENVRSRVEAVNDEGLLGTVISEQIANWSADVLVLGSHGQSGFAPAKIGDTGAALLKFAECDVLVVRRVTP